MPTTGPKSRPFPATALALCAMLVLLPGCTKIRTHQGYLVDRMLVGSIQPGIDTRESVEGTLGRPTFVGQFDAARPGGADYYYVARDTRQLAFANPKAVDATVLRVRFDAAGNVVAVDRTGMDRIAKLSPVDDKTPTLGRDRTLFQEIFGNIGAVGAGGAGGRSNDNTGPNGS